jgi:hypothetical protein
MELRSKGSRASRAVSCAASSTRRAIARIPPTIPCWPTHARKTAPSFAWPPAARCQGQFTADARCSERRSDARAQARRRGGPLHWLRSANIWQKGTSLRGGVRRLRGMTTILRKYHSVARCTLLGEMIEDTAHRYYYRPHVGGELTFADKESPAIHLTPCPACPDWPAGQQRGSAVGTNSR